MTLSVKDVSLGKRLSGVTLALEPGTVTAICGPNGAGKSSLLEVMAGLLKPDTGETLLRDLLPGRDNPRERARRIGYLPQSPEIAWDVPVRGLIELGRMPHGDRAKGPVDAAIDALDLRPFEQRRVLKQHPDLCAQLAQASFVQVGDVLPQHIHAPAVRAKQPQDVLHQHALPQHSPK